MKRLFKYIIGLIKKRPAPSMHCEYPPEIPLYKIIENIKDDGEMQYEVIAPYLRSINTYFSDYFCGEVIIMVTFVCNAIQGCKVVSANEWHEVLNKYLDTCDLSGEERICEEEIISFNSFFLNETLNK